MLSDELVQLLTAAVDGELSQRQRKAVAKLLQRSAEARELLRQLQKNVRKVHELPRHKLDADFSKDVVRAIVERRLQPSAPRKPVVRRYWLRYVAAGAAAAMLLVSIGLVYYVAMTGERASSTVASNPTPAVKVVPDRDTVEADTVPQRKLPNPLVAHLVEGVYSQYAAPIPPERALSVAFQDLQKDDKANAQLAAELKKSPSVRLEVAVRNGPQAVERLQRAFKDNGIKLVIDPNSGNSLKQNLPTGEYWVYADNLRPEELAKILKQLAADEVQPSQNPRKTPFEKVTVSALNNAEQRQVVARLGADPAKLEGSSQGMMNNANNSKAVRPVTAERVAVVLPPSPVSRPSEEVRQFLYQPNRPQPGALRVLVKIRQE
jgi:hypothetical protein